MSLITEQFTKDSGPRKVSVMARVFKSGRTVASMRVTGKTIWPTVEADLSTLMATSTKESG